MPKKPAVNGYALFVDEKRKNGVHCKGNPYEYFGTAWQALPTEAKKKYTDMAKEIKFRNKSDMECKFTTSGQSYAEVDRIRQEKENKLYEMNKTITDTVAALALEDKLAHHPFFLMHVNYFCVSDQGVYYPAEVGLVKFTLANGIEDFYHKILHPGPFPTGLLRNAMEHSAETHNLPCPPDAKTAERDFNKVDREIKQFLLGKEGFSDALHMFRETHKPIALPPIYTYYSKEMMHYKDNDVIVRSFMDNLPECMRERYTVRVYELTKLLYELANTCAQQAGHEYAFPSIIVAQGELERDSFSHSVGIACPFHEEGNYMSQCSLSWAKRWGFTIADFCCKHLGISLIPGAHCPIKAALFQVIDMPANLHQREMTVERKVQPAQEPKSQPQAVETPTSTEVVKKRVPIKDPLKALRPPQASCIDMLAVQFSEKLKTSSVPQGCVLAGAGRGVAGATPLVGAGRGAAIAMKLGLGRATTGSVAAAGRGRQVVPSSDE